MRMHMLRVISIDPLFPDDDHHMDVAANDAECGPVLLQPLKIAAIETSLAVSENDAYWLGGYAGI
ncbi:hypothetical protein ELE36_08005 [Pseudolysobacter antarcticus]|uniref:Uncharacterized protein n=1 Tax=Pseudolysobacter antarcticus TaxID=2511995 RepID=A0A411HIU1_9GAMM|nr:hypothetical protein [Pseudolysobacter antarcticus]QBB70310.1 hypothetical protein ELE36_08005 [Pseudolysobacter antarcticus]